MSGLKKFLKESVCEYELTVCSVAPGSQQLDVSETKFITTGSDCYKNH